MDKYPPFFERCWKRPNEVAPFPNIWSKFTAESPSGQIYRIRIQDVTPDQYNELWDLYKDYFFADEELEKSAEVLKDELSMISTKWSTLQSLRQNLSIVAVIDQDQESAKPVIIGALLLVVFSRGDPPIPELPGKARAKLTKLYDKVFYESVDVFEKLKLNHYFTDWGLVVRPEYRRLGVASELVKTVEKMAEMFKVPATTMIFQNISSQNLGAKLGFSVLNEVKLCDYVDEDGQMILPTGNTKVVQSAYTQYNFL